MSFNQFEDAILAYAIERLKFRYEAAYGPYKGQFYLGNGIRFVTIKSGPNNGKLTVGKLNGKGRYVPDPKIAPVDYLNLMKPDEGIADAVARLEAKGFFAKSPSRLEWELQAA